MFGRGGRAVGGMAGEENEGLLPFGLVFVCVGNFYVRASD